MPNCSLSPKQWRWRIVQGQVQVAVRKLLCKYGKEVGSISVTGHSLGGALASLCAFDIANSNINRQVPCCQLLAPLKHRCKSWNEVNSTVYRDRKHCLNVQQMPTWDSFTKSRKTLYSCLHPALDPSKGLSKAFVRERRGLCAGRQPPWHSTAGDCLHF